MEPEIDLFRELELARAECARLREENARLKRQLSGRDQTHAGIDPAGMSSDNDALVANSSASSKDTSGIDAAAVTEPGGRIGHGDKLKFIGQAPVTNTSEPEAKIALFRNLFRGREDVYAIRWLGRNGKSGYSPAAPRDDNRGSRTTDYKKRKCFPLTDVVIRDHLLGKHTVGIYPLLPDETCWFLAVDFDKRAWQADASAFMTTCRAFGLPAALERSRSGSGGHVWLFFESPLLAATIILPMPRQASVKARSRPQLG